MNVKIAEFRPAYKNDKDKTVPPKMVDGNGTDYVVPKELVDFVSTHQGQTVDIESIEKVNGRWTNRYLTAAVEPKAPEKNGWRRDPEESRHIIRQTALKASVELFGALYQGKGKESGLSTKPILKTAEIFFDWVLRTRTDPESPVEDIPW